MPDSANSMPPIAELLTWHIQSATVLQHPDIPARIKVRALQKLADTHRASLDQVSRAFPDVDFGSIEHNLAGSQLSELLSALAPDYEFAWANFELRITAPASAEQPIAQQTSPSLDVDPPAQTSAHLTISALKSIDQPLPIKIGEPNDQPTSPDAAPTSSTPIQIQLHTKPTAPTQPTKIEITTPTGPNTQPGKSPETTSQPLVTVQRARLINADDAKAASAQKQKSSERRPAAPRPLSATELQNVRSGPPIPWHLLLGAVLVVAGVAPFAFAILLNADPIGKLLFFHIATWGLLGLGELLATSTSNNDAAATFSGICGYLAPLNAIAAAYVGLSPPLLGIFAISLTTLLFLSLTKLDSTARWPILSLVILSILHLFVGEKDSADAIGLVGLGCIIGAIVLSIPESIKANLAENLPLSSLRGSHASTLFANAFAFFILLIRLASLNKTSPSALACAATFFPTGAVLLGANLSSIPQARPTANLSYSLGLIFTPLVCLFINQADLPGITPLSLAVLLSLLSLFVAWEFRPFGSAPAFGALLLSLLMLGSQSRAMADPLLMLGGAIFLATGIYLALSFIHHQKSESKDFEQNIAPLIGALLAELFAVGLLYAQVSHYASPSPGAQAFILLSIALPFLLLGGATSFRAESSASSSAAGFLSLRFAELLCAAAVIVASRSPLTALVLALLFASLRIPSLRLLLSEANARPWLNYGHGLSTLAAVVGTLTLLPATQDPLKSLALLVWTASALATTQVAGFGIAMALLALTTLKLTMPWPDSSLSFDQIADINLRLLFLTLVAWLPSLILSAQPQDPESKQDDGLTWRLRIARQAAIVYSFIGTALACAGATQVFARSITLPAPRLLILLLLPGLGFIMLARESYERRSKALGTLASSCPSPPSTSPSNAAVKSASSPTSNATGPSPSASFP
jgi:hypothetical protein